MEIVNVAKLTNEKWLNLFAAAFEHHGHTGRWLFASRKAEPHQGPGPGDAVVIVPLLRKVQLQIAVNEDFVEPTVNAIMEAGRTGPEGRIGDGKIFILPLEDCIRIRTGERGPEAI